ncbi:hypothetical protein [Mesorhizobium sp. NZP2298]|uniref:hypothetical protein n=1 Tax=Mesorhizobium sp. NZP2298 TaxID=2483403 RepID=UPI001557A89A|nr:hypothetical protein [Mesorhizobium sp. NZP2298]
MISHRDNGRHFNSVAWTVCALICLFGLSNNGVKAQESGVLHTVENSAIPGALPFELLAVNKDNSEVSQVSATDAKVSLGSVTLVKQEPAQLLSQIREITGSHNFRLDGDLVEFLFRVNNAPDLVSLAQKPTVLVPTAEIGSADIRARIEGGDQLVVVLDRKLKDDLRNELEAFRKATQELGAMAGSNAVLAQQIGAMRPLSEAWANALDARQRPFSIQSLEDLNEQYKTLNELILRFSRGEKLEDTALATAEDIFTDGQYQASFLSETLGSTLNPAGGTRMAMNVEVRLWGDLAMTKPQRGITIFYSKPYLTNPSQFRRAGLSSPVTFSAMYGMYCVWAEEPVGTVVTEIAMLEPPNHFDEQAPPVDLIYLGKKAQKSPNRCQQ